MGPIAYVADDFGLRLIDVSDPAAPVEVGSLELPRYAERVAVSGARAYVTSSVSLDPDLLHVIDISDPTAPAELAAIELADDPDGLAVVGGRAYVGVGTALRIFDVSTDGTPIELGAVATGDAAWDLQVLGPLVYVASGGGGLRIFDLGPEYAQVASIDFRPGSRHNRIRPEGRGLVPVALLGSDTLDVSEVDGSTLGLGPSSAVVRRRVLLKDVNRDGFRDLVARFRNRETGIARGDTQACLRGRLLDGTRFEGCDAILTPPR